jgi:enoyl-CoA hydratase
MTSKGKSMSDRYARYTRLKFDRPHPSVLRITMNSPRKLGAMDVIMHHELSKIWSEADADPSVSAIIITGAGKTFSSGGDLKDEINIRRDYNQWMPMMRDAQNLVYGMINCSKPIISGVRGWAVGAGIVCALMADISIAAKDAKFSDGHTKIGMNAGDHAVIIWPLLVGMAKAKYYLLCCEPLDGAEAERIGLVSLAVEDSEVEAKTVAIASKLAEGPPWAIHCTKYTLNHWLRQAGPMFDHSLAVEFMGITGPEGKEGVTAFVEKRPTKFSPLPRWPFEL